MRNLRLFIRLSRPLFLLGPIVLYGLGGGIARYLGINIDWDVYILGQLWVTLLQLSVHYLNEYYNAPADSDNPNRTILTGGSGAVGPGKLSRQVPWIAALTTLTLLASLTVVIFSQAQLVPLAYLIMVLAFLGAFFYSAPPVRLEASGYGELTTTLLVSLLLPAYSFVLQAGELHRLIAMCAFPLAALHLAMLLAFEFPDYTVDQKYEKFTLLIRLGWQRGMIMHNLLVPSAFLLLLLAASFGFPWFATWPSLLLLPLGAWQILQMRWISDGAKPNWNLLTLGGLALFGIMAYLMAFAFWMR